jgi:glutamate-1-semialdehyde 2,1-aminomutase
LNGNPLSACAGLATLAVLQRPDAYERLRQVGETLRAGLRSIVAQLGIEGQVLGVGPLANIHFAAAPITDYRSSLNSDSRTTQALSRGLLERGVLTNLAAKMYLSLAHSDLDIHETLQVFDDMLRRITSCGR